MQYRHLETWNTMFYPDILLTETYVGKCNNATYPYKVTMLSSGMQA